MASGTVQTAEDRCSGRTTGLLSRLCRLAADGLAAEVRTGTQLQNLVCLCKMRMPRTDVSHNQIERIRETQNPLLRSPDLLCRQPQKCPRKPRCRALAARGNPRGISGYYAFWRAMRAISTVPPCDYLSLGRAEGVRMLT